MEPSLDASFSRSSGVEWRRVEGQDMLLRVDQGTVDVDATYGLNAVGMLIWSQLDGERTGREIVTAIVDRFDVSSERAARDYLAFVVHLESLGAIVGPKTTGR